jgi:hypothetical protein
LTLSALRLPASTAAATPAGSAEAATEIAATAAATINAIFRMPTSLAFPFDCRYRASRRDSSQQPRFK